MLKVFVIEDAEATRLNVERLIGQEEGLQLCGSAAVLTTARALLSAQPPDVVVVALRDGRADLVQAVKEVVPSARIVATGVDESDDVIDQAIGFGAVKYLPKPYGAEELLAALR